MNIKNWKYLNKIPNIVSQKSSFLDTEKRMGQSIKI